MDKFKELVSLCKCSVEISVNNHKDNYQTVHQYFQDYFMGAEPDDITEDVFKGMVEKDTIVKVQAYPQTPIGFYIIFHYDIDAAVDQALAAVRGE